MSHLHSSYNHPILRQFTSNLPSLSNLIYPVFVSDRASEVYPMPSLPGQFRYGYENVAEELLPLVKKGLKAILIFGVITQSKDEEGQMAFSSEGPTQKSTINIRRAFSREQLLIITDCCLCGFRQDGNCGVFVQKKRLLGEGGNEQNDLVLDNKKSVDMMVQIAMSQAWAGSDVIAPSDMMEGRISAIRQAFNTHNMQTTIMSYAAKFASAFYGPFRMVCDSAPTVGHRRDYQLPQGSGQLALRAAVQDYQAGADFIIIKPGMPNLDVVQRIRQENSVMCQLAVYQVSGEYAMILAAGEKGVLNQKDTVFEMLTSFKRAGADLIITYFVPQILDYYAEMDKSQM